MPLMRFLFEGGDGDQGYFGHSFIAERAEETWFPNANLRGPAWLSIITTGPHKGEYLALTSRVVASLEEQLSVRDYLSVIVHLVKSPGDGFVVNEKNLPAIGMAVIKVSAPQNPLIFRNPW